MWFLCLCTCSCVHTCASNCVWVQTETSINWSWERPEGGAPTPWEDSSAWQEEGRPLFSVAAEPMKSHGLFSTDLQLPAAAKSLQSCPTLCDPVDGSPPGSSVSGILQSRTLEWVAISFFNAWKVKGKSLSRVWLLATPWTAAHQAPSFMGFSRQEYWSGLPLPSPIYQYTYL